MFLFRIERAVEKLLFRIWNSSRWIAFLRIVAQAGTAFLTLDKRVKIECEYEAYLDYEEKYLIPIWDKRYLENDLEFRLECLAREGYQPLFFYEVLKTPEAGPRLRRAYEASPTLMERMEA